MAAKKRKVNKGRPKVAKKIEKEPEYAVQITNHAALHKSLLESVREMILFMRGYEGFLRIQEEKTEHIAILKDDVKELKMLIENGLPKYLPKGKLYPAESKEYHKKTREPDKFAEFEPTEEESRPAREKEPETNQLDVLELQLKDIERQLRNIK